MTTVRALDRCVVPWHRHGPVPPHVLTVPGVYAPQDDTWLLADVVRELAPGRRVLDLCTGSGALAIVAARAGAQAVTAVDLSSRSVACARLNARAHRARIRVLRGDLFKPLRGERFDLVVCNPPYVPSASNLLPRHAAGRSWDAGHDGRVLLDRIGRGIGSVLDEDGELVLTHSSVIDADETIRRLGEVGLEARVVGRRSLPFGPVMRSRRRWLTARQLIDPGQVEEELVVIRATATAPADTAGGADS